MARNRTRNQRKLRVDPVTEELRELLKETPPSPVVEVVTASYPDLENQEIPSSILKYIDEGRKNKIILEQLGIIL